MAAPVGAATLYGTRRASSTMLCSMLLPPTGSAAKPLAMLRWVRPDQIVMLKLLRESRNKNLDFFAIRDCSELSNQGLRCKSAGKSVSWRPVFALWGRKRVPNRKKVAKMPHFLFSRWADCLNGQISQWAGCVGLFSSGFISSLFRKCPDSVTMRD